ncbi:MAG: helix-turn-helix domain-containing protein [Lachnospiraceae bacterium]|nr:helix-turn-helix domain-containing protein [Lachnospiraceae bacterium]
MDITLGVVLRLLSLDTTIYTKVVKEDEYIKGYEIWEPGMGIPQSNVLYLMEYQTLMMDPGIWKRKYVLCTGRLTAEELSGQEDYWISVSDSLRPMDLFRQLQRIFQIWYHWCIRLHEMILANSNLSELLETMEETFQIFSCISTQAMEIVGVSSGFEQHCSWVEQQTVLLHQVNELVTDEDFQNAKSEDNVFLYTNMYGECYYCYNLKISGQYRARIISGVEGWTKAYGVHGIVTVFGAALNKVYGEYDRQEDLIQGEQGMKHMLSDMLQGLVPMQFELRRQLETVHWVPTQTYQVLVIRFQDETNGGVGMSYYKTQIHALLQDCFVLQETDRFICVRNLSRWKELKDYDEILPYFLRETLCKAGISDTFRDFAQVRSYYLEALEALRIGERVDSTRWYYYFSRYTMPYMLQQCIKELMPEQVCHPALRILDEYDKKNETHLLETLEVFLRERHSIAHSAALLDIHRTTLLVRLERINHLTGIDIQDYPTCLHLMLSLEILHFSG